MMQHKIVTTTTLSLMNTLVTYNLQTHQDTRCNSFLPTCCTANKSVSHTECKLILLINSIERGTLANFIDIETIQEENFVWHAASDVYNIIE